MERAKISGKSPAISAVVYDQLKGVDFSTDPGLVAAERSPFAPNLVSGAGGYPEKRPGWRTVKQMKGAVYGMFSARVRGEELFVVHCGTKLYKWYPYQPEKEAEVLYEQMPEQYSQYFAYKDKLYILTGQEYLVYGEFDGAVQVKPVAELAKIPTIVISADPEKGGGVLLEDANLLTAKRKAGYYSLQGIQQLFILPEQKVRNETLIIRILNGKTGEWDEEDLSSQIVDFQPTPYSTIELEFGEQTTITDINSYINSYYLLYKGLYWKKREYSAGSRGKVFFNKEYGLMRLHYHFFEGKDKAKTGGADNVELIYEVQQTEDRYTLDTIQKCTICTEFENRIFVSGNPDKPAFDWHSAVDDPTYFPETGYAQVGNNGSAIMGYNKTGSRLAIVKEDSQQDASIYMRSSAIMSDRTVFSLQQGVPGMGAVSKRAFVSLLDDPLYLTRSGVYAITSNLVTEERTMVNRSRFLDPRLTHEKHLADAVGCSWNGMLLLSMTDGTVYLLDGKQNKVYMENSLTGTGYNYEAYHWTNMPATVWMPDEGNLFFGTADGKLCRLNTDIEGVQKYNDDGKPVKAARATRMEFCGDFLRYKTMVKKGSGLLMHPYSRGSVRVYVRTDRTQTEEFFQTGLDDFDWYGDEAGDDFFIWKGAQVVPFGKKVKKWKWIQLILENDELNEGFGVYGVIIRHQKLNLV